MARTNPGNPLAGQAPDQSSHEDVVDRPPPVDDHLGVEQSIEQSTEQSTEPPVEPPIILAMTRSEAVKIINLLNLDPTPEARALLYRLCGKYAVHCGVSMEIKRFAI